MSAIFHIVYIALQWCSNITGFTYKEINIIAYYLLIPLVYFYLIDRIIKKRIFVPSLIVFWLLMLLIAPSFKELAEVAFDGSVVFLKAFSLIGWNYVVASVIICVVIPLIVFCVLLYFAYPKIFKRDLVHD